MSLKRRTPPSSSGVVDLLACSSDDDDNKNDTSSTHKKIKQQQPYKLFCDLDGVLVDFERGVETCTGSTVESFQNNRGHLFAALQKQSLSSFYANLPWMSDGKELWTAIEHLQPTILTGVPNNKGARFGKVEWCKRELLLCNTNNTNDVRHVDMAGPQSEHTRVNRDLDDSAAAAAAAATLTVITCWSRNKHCESGPNAILIDDDANLKEAWKHKKGIFIHHTSTENTLRQLKKLGVDLRRNDDTKNDVSSAETSPATPPISSKKQKSTTNIDKDFQAWRRENDLVDSPPPDTP